MTNYGVTHALGGNMPECCLCNSTCVCGLLFVLILLFFVILIFRRNSVAMTQVNNSSGAAPPPPPPSPKNKCLEILKCILGCGTFLIVLAYLTCMYPIKVQRYFIYDTNKENSDFVIESLKVNKLMLLDKVLMVEKEDCGLRIGDSRVRTMIDGDQEVFDAYARWRIIFNLSRSQDHTIYPDERQRYIRDYSLFWPRKMIVRVDRLLPFCRKLPLIK